MRLNYVLTPFLVSLLLLISVGVVFSQAAETTATGVHEPAAISNLDFTHQMLPPVALSAAATVSPTMWLQQWGWDQGDQVNNIVVDSIGFIYVHGSFFGENQLAKYNRAGDQLWLRPTESGYFAVDVSGNIYITNSRFSAPPTSDALLTKYDNAGEQLWERQWTVNDVDWPKVIVTDHNGDVYVAGITIFKTTSPYDENYIWVAKYDGTGNQLWLHQWGFGGEGTFYSNEVRDIAIGTNGDVYLIGETSGDWIENNAGGELARQDVWVAKYDSAGNQLWLGQWGSIYDFKAAGIAIATNGDVYVISYTNDPSLDDVWLVKYNSNGVQQWIHQWGSDQYVTPSGIVIDTNDDVYVSGQTSGDLGGPNAGWSDAWLVKYDSAGNQLWLHQWGSGQSDTLSGIVISANDNVYVSGQTLGDLGGPNAGGFDAWLAKYDSDGNQLWLQQWGSAEHDYLYATTVDVRGNIYLGGTTYGDLGGPNAGVGDAWLAGFLEPQPWTLMFYLDGDNDLSDTYPPILNQLEAAADNPNVNVLVFWDNDQPNDTGYGEVVYDTDLENFADYTPGLNSWDQGELDAGDPQSLSDFVIWAMTNYPSEHYALLLDDHGTGLSGGLLDDTSNSGMDLPEMKQALEVIYQQTSNKIDVLYMNMCLMGMLEDAYQFRDYANYYVASEALQTAWNEPYARYVSEIKADSTPEEVAVQFANAYADVSEAGEEYYTISVADISQLSEVVSATNELAEILFVNMDTISATVQTVANQVQRYDNEEDDAINTKDTYVDLYHFAELLRNEILAHSDASSDTEIVTSTIQLMSVIENDYIIAERHGSTDDRKLDDSHGVSIFSQQRPAATTMMIAVTLLSVPIGKLSCIFTLSKKGQPGATCWRNTFRSLSQVVQMTPPHPSR